MYRETSHHQFTHFVMVLSTPVLIWLHIEYLHGDSYQPTDWSNHASLLAPPAYIWFIRECGDSPVPSNCQEPTLVQKVQQACHLCSPGHCHLLQTSPVHVSPHLWRSKVMAADGTISIYTLTSPDCEAVISLLSIPSKAIAVISWLP